MNTRARAVLFVGVFIVAGTFLGGMVHNPFDPQRYARGALGVLQGTNIYELRGVVYPPPLYVGSSLVLYVTSLFTPVRPGSYVTIATFVGIGTTIQAGSYWLGTRLVPDSESIQWAVACLFNPFVLFVVVLFGQMESFVILGLVGVIYAEQAARWELGGALLSVAAAVKIFPAILFIPFIWRNRDAATRILRGAAPVGVLTTVLMLVYAPTSFGIFFSAFWGIRPINALYILSLSTAPSWVASVVFAGTFVLAGVLVAVVDFDSSVGYLVPLVPVVLFYPDVIEYRWLPLAVGALLVGYSRDPRPAIRTVCRRYGWAWILLGMVAIFIGSIKSLYTGDPYLIPTIDAVPQLSVVLAGWYPSFPFSGVLPFEDSTVVDIAYSGVALVYIVSVGNWLRLVWVHSRDSIRFQRTSPSPTDE